jgi:hypothetical protein
MSRLKSNFSGRSILPLGKINLTTGKSLYFNIYQTWGEDTCYEIIKPDEGNLRIVATSGKTPISKPGENNTFLHDQTGRYLFSGVIIDSAVGSGLKELAKKYGNSISGYTYK